MTTVRIAPAGDRIIEPMIALARCQAHHRIVVAGDRSVEQMLELQRRGYAHTASTANCGHPSAQYDVALVDWRRRTFKAFEATFGWMVGFLRPGGMLVVWVDPHKPAAIECVRAAIEKRGFIIEGGTVHDCGCAVSARRREASPLRQAA